MHSTSTELPTTQPTSPTANKALLKTEKVRQFPVQWPSPLPLWQHAKMNHRELGDAWMNGILEAADADIQGNHARAACWCEYAYGVSCLGLRLQPEHTHCWITQATLAAIYHEKFGVTPSDKSLHLMPRIRHILRINNNVSHTLRAQLNDVLEKPELQHAYFEEYLSLPL